MVKKADRDLRSETLVASANAGVLTAIEARSKGPAVGAKPLLAMVDCAACGPPAGENFREHELPGAASWRRHHPRYSRTNRCRRGLGFRRRRRDAAARSGSRVRAPRPEEDCAESSRRELHR